ncbi:retrovirus-related pol polyprotein from transposon TNT 1-94 [Tanacetum coccineum]
MIPSSQVTYLTTVVTSLYPTTNNQLRNSSNPRQQATINNGRVTLQKIQGRQTSLVVGTTRTYTPGSKSYYSECGMNSTFQSISHGDLSHYGSDALAEYVIESQQAVVQNSNSSTQQDALILSLIEQLKTQVVNCTKINLDNKSVNDTLTAELERYKEQVKVLKEGQNVDLRSNDTVSDSSADNSVSNQSAPSFDQLFELNELKAQSQKKDTIIKKLKERIKSLRVSKLIAENEHLKQTYKQLYDSIKPSRIRSKEQCDALINQVNLKSVEISDLNASLHEKSLEITALKDDLKKLKGKALVNNAVMKHTIDPEMLKIDVEQITSTLLNKKTAHSAYIKHTQEEATVLRDLVKHVKSKYPLDHSLESACTMLKKSGVAYTQQVKPARERPTGRTFTIVGNACPLTRITTTTEVPLRKPTALENETPKPVLKFVSANKKEPSQSWGSIVSDVLSSSLDECRSKDEAPDFIIKFLKMIQVRLKVTVRRIRTDNGTEFVNQTLREYYEKIGISHETSVARSPQQNGVVERRNRTLIEAARTMLIYAKAPLFLWAEAVATACYTQNRSIVRLRHGKTPYELLHDKPPDLSFFHVFGALCYPTNDSENLGKLQPKADIGIFIGYAPTKKAFRIYNRRTRRIIETIHVDFDELTAMASEHSSSEPALHEMTPATISSGLVPNPPPSTPFVPPSRSDWDILFQPLFDELHTPPPNVDLPAPEVIAPIVEVVAPEPADSTGSPSSTTVDQDAPSASNSQSTTKKTITTLILHT